MSDQPKEVNSAKKILDFYIDLVENNSSTAKFYLSENVVLDWFGKTIRGNKKVLVYIKEQLSREITHHISNAVPSQNVAFKETHHVEVPNDENVILLPSTPAKSETTPPKRAQPSTSTIEMGQGDGLHNCSVSSPPKRMKFGAAGDDGIETVESEAEVNPLKYITAEGSVEFCKPSNNKKLQTDRRWKRPVKLHLGYTTTSFKDCNIYLIIYEGNLKCRRNLYKEFCEGEASA